MFKKKLSIKLIVSLSLVILFIFLVSGYVTYRVYLQLFTTEVSKQFSKANEQAAARVDFQIENIKKSTNYIVFHPYIEEILKRSAERNDNNQFNRILDQDELNRLLNQISIDEPKLTSMYLYDAKGSGYFFENNTGTVIRLGNDIYDAIQHSLDGTNGELVWLPVQIPSTSSSGHRNVISVSRYMKNKQQELYGTLILFFEESIFASILDELTEGEKAKIFLLDKHAKTIYSNQLNGNKDSETLIQAANSSIVKQGKESMVVSRNVTRQSEVTLISALSLESINNQSQVIFQIALYSGIASILCASLLIFFTGKRLLMPLQTLVRGMTKLRGGNFGTRVRISTQDELAFLGHSFNEMAENIEALVKEVYERQLHEREAELTALQAQLNPHFLYNTLDTIYFKMYLGENDEQAANLVLSLSGLLRYALQNANTKTTVKEEIEHIRKYMSIQSARIGNKLETFIQVDEEAEQVPIIRLILQPLVENVFVHAFANQSKMCILRIKVSLRNRKMKDEGEEAVLCIEVSDNGQGMPKDKLDMLKARQNAATGELSNSSGGIGLHTVIRRVSLLYGPPYGLEIESEPGSGTVMRLILPIQEKVKGE
jgi:two-component system sensor histidine kinase YesM